LPERPEVTLEHCQAAVPGDSEETMKFHFALRVARSFFLASAMAAPVVSAAVDNGSKGTADGTGISLEQVPSTDAWFNADALDLNVYGLSYHPDREAVHRLDLDNEFNPGLAIHYELLNNSRGITFAEAGAYEDSGRSLAMFAGLGYQFKLGEHWRVGGALALMNSETYNDGTTFVGMIPLITYDFGRIKLNAAYFPKFGHYNRIAAFGLYLGIPFGRPDG
jgi:hypothetical protein